MKKLMSILIPVVMLTCMLSTGVFATSTESATGTEVPVATETVTEQDVINPIDAYIDQVNGVLTVKQAGYYAILVSNATGFYTIRDSEYIEYATITSAEADMKYVHYDVGAILPFQFAEDTAAGLYFSQDGVATTTVFSLVYTAATEVQSGTILTPTLSFTRKSVSDSELIVTLTCSVSETLKTGGVSLRTCDILDSSLKPLTVIKSWTDGSLTDSFDFKITSNGTYWLRVSDSNDTYMRVEIDVSNIVSGVNGDPSDRITDREPPVIAVGSLPKNITNGTTYSITVKTNEVCNINIDAKEYQGVSEASFDVSGNGTYQVSAVDKSGNISTTVINVDGYGAEVLAPKQDDTNRDTFWGDALASGMILPQTGIISWLTLTIVLGVALVTALVVLVIRRRKLGGTKNEI